MVDSSNPGRRGRWNGLEGNRLRILLRERREAERDHRTDSKTPGLNRLVNLPGYSPMLRESGAGRERRPPETCQGPGNFRKGRSETALPDHFGAEEFLRNPNPGPHHQAHWLWFRCANAAASEGSARATRQTNSPPLRPTSPGLPAVKRYPLNGWPRR